MDERTITKQELLSELLTLRTQYQRAIEALCHNESRLEALLLLSRMQGESEADVIQFVLEEGGQLTDSPFGYLAFLNGETVTLHAWLRGEIQAPIQHPLESDGLWGECLRARRPIIDNEAQVSSVRRHLSVPIFDGDRLVLVAGFGNKEEAYESADVRQLTLLMDGMWKTLQFRRLLEERKEIEVLRQADRLKDEILSIVSHELRTPLNAIVGFTSLLEDGAVGPMSKRQREFLGKILHHSEKMESLIEELLDLAQMKAGRFRVFPAKTPYLPLIEEVVQGLRPLLDGKRLTLEPQIEVGPVPLLDRSRIHQVLTNLLYNAIKFTPPEGAIRVQAFVRENELVTEVSDTGIGIAPEDLPKLFQPFHQLDMSLTREVGGTGLGLSISRGILEAHGGCLEAESPGLGKGATFRFRLPLEGAIGAPDGAAC